ncbi:MAG: glycosyltransferase [Chlorobi bacterium]|nr:glycosyltransferase [Chlorobiota bacterium]
MKIVIIGTYPPRQCGIGTFTQDLFNSLINNRSSSYEGFIVAINEMGQKYNYPEEVKHIINQERLQDYPKAADFINKSGVNLCILEHEYGVFGGKSGVYILSLLHRLKIPLVVTLHTILEKPSSDEKDILQEACKMAERIVVMSHKAIIFLVDIYKIPENKIVLIEHGVPDLHFDQEESKEELKLQNKKVLLTFGFVGRNKGIETVIKALPGVVEKYPNILYIILGKTHPNVLRHSGEEYRDFLQELSASLGVEKYVCFLNHFIGKIGLFKYLCASDIYITPYLNKAQITSGTLSYAIGAGSAVISTPYWHAKELLAEGRGRLFDFYDSEGLASLLLEILDTPEIFHSLRSKAYNYGKKITWGEIGKKYIALARDVMSKQKIKIGEKTTLNLSAVPIFSLAHVKRLTDSTGIIQHAKFSTPNFKEGYCLDDNARALLLAVMAYQWEKDPVALELCPTYLSYIHYMQNDDGSFRNFLSFKREFMEKTGSEDSFGRAAWALGYLLNNAPNDSYYQMGNALFFNSSPHFEKLKSIRAIAYTIIGICHYLNKAPSDDKMTGLLQNLIYKLTGQYQKYSSPDWKWFEHSLTYDNGILPLALLHSTKILQDDKITSIGLESMDFLTRLSFKDGHLSVIGNKKWYMKGRERSQFDQQPIDVMAMVLMYQQAFYLTKEKVFLDKLNQSFMWFLGENDLRMKLFDYESKGCCDGLESDGVNRNQGAESTLAFWISQITVVQTNINYRKISKNFIN